MPAKTPATDRNLGFPSFRVSGFPLARPILNVLQGLLHFHELRALLGQSSGELTPLDPPASAPLAGGPSSARGAPSRLSSLFLATEPTLTVAGVDLCPRIGR